MSETSCFIINTTYVVTPEVEQQFLTHLREFYIPKAMATELLIRPRLHRILRPNEDGCISYALQFSASGAAAYEEWLSERGNLLQRGLAHKFGHSVMAFVTPMEEVDWNGR